MNPTESWQPGASAAPPSGPNGTSGSLEDPRVVRAMEEYQAGASATAAQGAIYSLPLQGIARLYRQDNNDEKALESIQKAIQLEPKLASNYLLLGKIYVTAGDLAKGVAALRQAVELDPADAAPYHLLFRTYLKLKMAAEAKWAQGRFEEVKKAYGED